MEVILQDHLQPERILDALIRSVDASVSELGIAVAYATLAGSQLLASRLSRELGRAQWESVPKRIITCFDHGTTEPSALRYWRNIPNTDLRIYGARLLATRRVERERNAFHVKLFYFKKPDRATLIVGSANLTRRALTTNAEAITKFDVAADSADITTNWTRLHAGTIVPDDNLINQYEFLRSFNLPRLKVDEPLRPRNIEPRLLQTFWSVVSAAIIDPTAFENFWVDAGAMSSGGSNNQLELPRGANRFFGYGFANYGDDHALIGQPILRSGPNSWTDRRLTWHGKNQMERINLPTAAQGGFDYVGTIVLFRRLNATTFEILVEPPTSDVAVAWINASIETDRVFRAGNTSTRTCGLF